MPDSLASALTVELFTIGTTPVTLMGLLRVVAILALAWWLSRVIRYGLSRAAARLPGMNAASVYTLGRVLHYVVITLGVVIGLSTIGVGFTNMAIIMGALGVGVGFGLQEMISNFVSGLIIMFEGSLKVGDFIELESGLFGEVREIRIRATQIVTNDNIDILVPNSQFVNGRVVNWTLGEASRRIHVPFGVAYGTDKEQVRRVVLDAAGGVAYTLTGVAGREPQVWFVKFGDSSLDFELVVWLQPDAVKRPASVQAAYLWEIHTALITHGIEIPFPQRDLHVKSVFGLAAAPARQWVERTSGPDASP
jgi:potassium efflux system protein